MYINIHNDSLGMSNIIVEEELETDEAFLYLYISSCIFINIHIYIYIYEEIDI
jgi:hypothetical protein